MVGTHNFRRYFKNDYPRNWQEDYTKNDNMFGYLSNELEFHKCNNLGNLAKDCRLTAPPRESQQNQNA